MSEPDVEVAVSAGKVREAPKIQRVTLQGKTAEPVEDGDERVANLVRMGLTEVEARAAIHDVSMF